MSKINPVQTAALKTETAKVEATKLVTKKPVITKTAAAKALEIKSVVTETKVNKPAAPKPAVVKAPTKKAIKAKVVKIENEKTPKLKMERDSFTMPKLEYAQFYVLKERLVKLGQPVKKSELLRAGIMQLTAMTDAALKTAMGKVPAIKTGRPNKK